MKKLILILLFPLLTFSQTFIKKYDYFFIKNNNVTSDWEKSDITAVFKENNVIYLYYPNGEKSTFYQTTRAVNDVNKNNEKFQTINCINEVGKDIIVQLFDDGTLRIILSKNHYIEMHNKI